MAEPKKRAQPKKKKKSTGRSAGAKKPESGSSPETSSTETAAADFQGRADQLGSILAKGLDLAEAGLSLGLKVITRVGAAAQQGVFDRIGASVESPEAAGFQPGGAEAPTAPPASPLGPAAPEVTVPEEELYCITNRLPLAPGGSFKVSFSINNDSMAAPKNLSLRAEGFIGENERAPLDAEGFKVKPMRKTIAPMDFEKFVLEGVVPPETPPDVYHGWIVVTSGDEFRIPVRLVVLLP